MIDNSCGRHFFGRVHRGKEENRGSSGNIDVLGRFPSRVSGICRGQIPDFVQEERSKDAIGASKKDGVERWVPWNSLILKYLEQGRCEEAVRMIEETCLEEEESVPSESLIVAALNRLSSPRMLEAGKRIHCVASCLNLVESKRKRVGVALLGMYVRCGSIESARKLFDSMAVERNGECWTVMISAYVRRGWINEALLLFKKSLLEGVRPSEGTFIALLHACSRPASLDQGKKLHRLLEEAGFQESIAPSLATSLIKMYGKCGSLDEAWKVMEKIESRDVELWTVMIASLSHFGKLDRAFELLKRMDLEGDRPSKMTFMAVLRACKDHPEARQVGGVLHGLIRERGLESDVGVGTSLVNMYARWGDPQQAQEVFSQIEARDVSSWNCLLAAYSRCSRQEQALVLYRKMMLEGVKPDRLTLNTVIDVCASLKDLEQGSRIHQQIASSGFASDLMLDTALITFYGCCGKLEAALEIFEALPARDNVTWNTMIASLNDHSSPEAAMGFFQRMQQEGMAPSRVTLLTVLGLCGSVGEAKLVHSCVRESGFEQDSEVKNTLITAYGRCGGLPQAVEIFEALPRKIESSWNAMMGAYAAQGKPRAALELFHRMVKLEQMIQPSVSTIILALNSCQSLADGKLVISSIPESLVEEDGFVQAAMVDMLARCGSLDDASEFFHKLGKNKDTVLWTTMVAAFARHGHSARALGLFEAMLLDGGGSPDEVTLVSVLSACSHAGLLHRGLQIFASTASDFGVQWRSLELYGCAIDLLGRAGQLQEAEMLVASSDFSGSSVLWITLLGASKVRGNEEAGKRAAVKVLELDPGNAAAHVILSNLAYSSDRDGDDLIHVAGDARSASDGPA